MADDQTAQPQKRSRVIRTKAQEIAYLEQRIAKIKTLEKKRSRKASDREKIIIGGAIVKAMRTDPEWRERVVALLKTDVTRDSDQEAIASWLSAT